MSSFRPRLLIILILITGLVGFIPQTNSTAITDPDQLNSGSINGIDYSYGENYFETSGNITREVNGSLLEVSQQSTTGVRDIALIKNTTFNDVYYQVYRTVQNSTDQTRWDQWYNTQTIQDGLFSYIFEQVPLKFDPNGTRGLELMAVNLTERYDIVTASVITSTGDFVGQYPLNISHIEYFDKNVVTDEVYYRSELIVPQVIVVDLELEVHQVYYNTTEISLTLLNYYNRYSVEYNISASANQVNITNGENFALLVNMFDQINAEYTEVALSAVFYQFYAAQFTQLQFSDNGVSGNGTLVEEKGFGYPMNMLPVEASSSGSIFEAGYRQISSKLLSTYQGVVAGFLTRAEETAMLDQTSIEARLAVWGVSTSTTMVAFNDGNDNGRLDLGMNNDGLFINQNDQVEAIGLAESYETNVTNAYYQSHNYNTSVVFHGLGFNYTETNVNNTFFNYNFESYSFGDVSSNTQSTFTFDDPVVDQNDNVEFNFGVSYTNFPVTWVNTTDGTTAIDYEDIGYDYKIIINPVTGEVAISTTWTYSGITDPILKSKADGLSLAILVKSEFFGARARYSATESNQTLNSSRTSQFAKLRVNTGSSADDTEIDVTGPKQYYTTNGVEHTANFDAVRLVTVTGTFKAEKVTAFSSESENTGGTASNGAVLERLKIDYIYTVDLVVITYGNWDGNDVVHDPDYNINYDAPERDDQDDQDDSSSSSIPQQVDSESSQQPALPGFQFVILANSLIIAIIIIKKFKNQE